MLRASLVGRALLCALASVGTVATVGCDGEPATSGVTPAPPPKSGPLRRYTFVVDNGRTWNDAVFVGIGDGAGGTALGDGPLTGRRIEEDGTFVVEARAGDEWLVRTEPGPTAAERVLLWLHEERGRFGDDETVRIGLREREPVQLRTDGVIGPVDRIVVHDEESGASACVVRDPRTFLGLCVWDKGGGKAYRHRAPPRPFSADQLLTRGRVVAARSGERQWVAVRVRADQRGPVVLDVAAAPAGGATLTSEDPHALLLLNGELPLPAPRVTTELVFRSVWHGVPPGRHVVRTSDGKEHPVTLKDGEEASIR